MTAFVLIAALMLLGALAVVFWPLWRARAASQRRWPGITIVSVVVPALALGLYFSLSNWAWNPADIPSGVPPEIDRMVRGLEARLRSNPSDVPGWLMLGRSQFQLERFAESANAYQEAYLLTQGKDIEAVTGLAEALMFADQTMLPRSAQLFEQAYVLAPENPKVLWYSGLIAYQSGRLALARERWMSFIALDPPPEIKNILQAQIARIEAQLGAAASGSEASDASAAQAAPQRVVKVRVAVAPELADRVPADAPLFVLVRAGEGGGPPLAVTRRSAAQLPALVELSDRDAMLAGSGLGDAKLVTVVARIARSGGPVARSGDLEGRVSYDLAQNAPVDLIINSIVP